MPVPLTLKIFKGTLLVGTKEFSRDIIKIGRLSSAHLSLEDEKISRIHSVIQVSNENQISILDMGSAEGTFVNGKRVSKGTLQNGDEITLGGVRLVLTVGSAGPMATPPSPAPISDGNAAMAIQPQLQPEIGLAPPSVAPVTSPTYQPTYQTDAQATAQLSTQPTYEMPPKSDSTIVVGRRRREAGPIADVNLSHRGRGAYVLAEDSNEEGVEVRVFWGETLMGSVLRVKPSEITIGESEKCDFVIPGLNLEAAFPLVRITKERQVLLRFTSGMDGELQPEGEAPIRLAQLGQKAIPDGDARALQLVSGSFAWLSLGNLSVEVELTPVPKKVVAPFWDSVDFRFINLALLMGFAMLAFIISAATYPFDTDTTADDLFRNPNKMNEVIFHPPPKQKSAFADKLSNEAKSAQKGEKAAKAAKSEGKMGMKDKPKKDAKSAPKAIDPNAKEIVKNSALMKALGASGGLSTITGIGGLGGELKGALGNMFGPVAGDAGGMGGLGLRGTGQGGGGFGNTIGIGDIGTKGRGGGLGGYGVGVGSLGKKSGSDVAISSGNPQVEGSMDKELIRKVIHEHRNQVRFCYEQELQRHPGLNGKVTVKFVIKADGSVGRSGVDNSTLGNANVENCIVARVYQWNFPKPKGGGVVQVSYPFLLKESGD